jgi:endonuclease G
MIKLYLILLLAVVLWKGFWVWRRGMRTYRKDRQLHESLREYLLGNGATEWEARRPFVKHAAVKALKPLLSQWRLFLVLVALGVLVVLLSGAAPSKPEKTDLTMVQVNKETTYLRRYAYKCWYSETMRIPLVVSWYLTGDHVSGSFKRKGVAFHADYDVKGLPVTTQDYIQSGYDRGHMCPSGDNKWHQLAQEQSFLMTNICPQNHQLNTNDWNDLEQRCRQWAKKYGRIYIVCGPVLRGDKHKTIGKQRKRRITVPEAFYKVVLRAGKDTTAIGFLYENNGERQKMRQAVCTVDKIEQLTGMDFFYQLPDAVEQRVERVSNIDMW